MVDAGGTFAEGQVYVALSRARSEARLWIRNLDLSKIRASPIATTFHRLVAGDEAKSELEKFLKHTPLWFHACCHTRYDRWRTAFTCESRFRKWLQDHPCPDRDPKLRVTETEGAVSGTRDTTKRSRETNSQDTSAVKRKCSQNEL